MLKEPQKIIFRRFRDRPLESGLLILAVALGIGAFSSGLSLVMNTARFSKSVMSSPAYKELVISTRSEAEEMETPVKEKLVQENAILTSADLEAAELAPDVQWAYVQNHARLRLITGESDDFGPPDGMAPPDSAAQATQSAAADSSASAASGGTSGNQPDNAVPPDFFRISDEEIAAAEADSSIIIPDIEEISGYEVTPQFFSAWGINAAAGSLFSESDLSSTGNLIVLGADLAKLLAKDGEDPADLLGKKLLARQGYQTIIGILEPVSESYDSQYFTPYKDQTGGFAGFRRMFMDTQLRFAVADPSELDSTAILLEGWFNSQFGEDQVVISNPRAEAEQLVARNTGVGILIMFLSAAGFFIALVNVSNILMSRVLRMKKNVGILMALGATRANIRNLFLMESLLLAGIGAAAGALLAVPLSDYMRTAAGIDSGSWLYIAAGAVLAGILTVLFGLIPSRQYMKIDPAQAMRSAS